MSGVGSLTQTREEHLALQVRNVECFLVVDIFPPLHCRVQDLGDPIGGRRVEPSWAKRVSAEQHLGDVVFDI